MAVAVALLMIGGEFDLSAGAMTGTTGLMVGVLTTWYGLSVWAALALALAFALAIGLFNGFVTMKTGLPSFIVTLGTFFILQGINLAVTKLITGQVAIQGMTAVPNYAAVKSIFGQSLHFGGSGFHLETAVIWWIAVTIVATWVLQRWIQPVSATPVGFSGFESSRSRASAGVDQPSRLRGRVLSCAATNSR